MMPVMSQVLGGRARGVRDRGVSGGARSPPKAKPKPSKRTPRAPGGGAGKNPAKGITYGGHEGSVRGACGTMCLARFSSMINKNTHLTEEHKAELIEDFKFQDMLLTAECNETPEACGLMMGGSSEAEAAVDDIDVEAVIDEIDWTECDNWESEDEDGNGGCVVEDGECLDFSEIAGDFETARFSDGKCYSKRKIQEHVLPDGKKPEEANFTFPGTKKRLTRGDARRMDMTRMYAYTQYNILASLRRQFVRAMNSRTAAATKKFEEIYLTLYPEERGKFRKAADAVLGATAKAAKFGYKGAKLGVTAASYALAPVWWVGGTLRSFAFIHGVPLAMWMAANPRVARFLLIVVRRVMHKMCRRLTLEYGRFLHEASSVAGAVSSRAGGVIKKYADRRDADYAEQIIEERDMTGKGLAWDSANALLDKAGVPEHLKEAVIMDVVNNIVEKGGAAGAKTMAYGLGLFASKLVKGIPILEGIVEGASAVGKLVTDSAIEAVAFGLQFAVWEHTLTGIGNDLMDILLKYLNPIACLRTLDIKKVNVSDLGRQPVSRRRSYGPQGEAGPRYYSTSDSQGRGVSAPVPKFK